MLSIFRKMVCRVLVFVGAIGSKAIMFNVKTCESAIDFTISSEPSSAYSVLEECDAFVKRYGVQDTASVTVVVRELLNNAIRHGNQQEASRLVKVSVSHVEGYRFRVEVEDEGEGFDYAALDMTPPQDPRLLESRGYILIHSLTERLVFNEKGNRVTAYLDLAD